jgi:hypothetical protein
VRAAISRQVALHIAVSVNGDVSCLMRKCGLTARYLGTTQALNHSIHATRCERVNWARIASALICVVVAMVVEMAEAMAAVVAMVVAVAMQWTPLIG